ncbi:holin [Idiomarinaceae phage Phi1M2-2]|uniref:holin n=1 Tax=Idiomarinaceae phage Phi1M2-2 TaxID=1527515 RepID=UPI0004F5BB2C|nr:holin [Idiomarinaceae phage Phi1M2-2]AIM40792.1 putative holin protein [Idiomarinaceae phage Phi1M2-2]
MKIKPWWKKKEVWGAITAFIALVAGAFGYAVDADALAGAIVGLIGAAGALVAIVTDARKREADDD